MLFEVQQLLFGVLVGFVIGLIPGLHINAMVPLALLFNANALFVISASITFMFSTLFPLSLLGVPDPDNVVSVLPAHKLFQRGKSIEAIHLSSVSMLLSLVFSCILLAFLSYLSPNYVQIRAFFPVVMCVVLASMLRGVKSIAIVVIAGVLGLMTFNQDMLFPLLTGFFGVSNLLYSHNTGAKPQLVKNRNQCHLFSACLISFSATFVSMFLSLVPAISSGLSSTIVSKLGYTKTKELLLVTSASAMAYMCFSLFTLSIFGMTRSGSAAALHEIGYQSLTTIVPAVLFAGTCSFIVMNLVSREIISLYSKTDPKRLNKFVLVVLLLLVLLFNGILGLLVLLLSTSVGLLCIRWRVKRINCMAALIIPTLLVLL